MPDKNNPGLYEQDDLSPQDLLDIQHPMLTMPDGRNVVSCTQCRKRPLKIAKLCDECYKERMEQAELRSKVSIIRRNMGKPKLTCPYCRTTDVCLELEVCCPSMRFSLLQIARENEAYSRSVKVVNGIDAL